MKKVINVWWKPSTSGRGQLKDTNNLIEVLTPVHHKLGPVHWRRPKRHLKRESSGQWSPRSLILRIYKKLTWPDWGPETSRLDRDLIPRWSFRRLPKGQRSTTYPWRRRSRDPPEYDPLRLLGVCLLWLGSGTDLPETWLRSWPSSDIGTDSGYSDGNHSLHLNIRSPKDPFVLTRVWYRLYSTSVKCPDKILSVTPVPVIRTAVSVTTHLKRDPGRRHIFLDESLALNLPDPTQRLDRVLDDTPVTVDRTDVPVPVRT